MMSTEYIQRRRSQVVKAAVCKTAIHRFESGRRLQMFGCDSAGVAELADAADLKYLASEIKRDCNAC